MVGVPASVVVVSDVVVSESVVTVVAVVSVDEALSPSSERATGECDCCEDAGSREHDSLHRVLLSVRVQAARDGAGSMSLDRDGGPRDCGDGSAVAAT